jgi:flavin-dependent dehydrogenase
LKAQKLAIVGGGLAGLTAAIHLAKKGFKIQLFEKEEFPHHKVCGEYLSTEVLPYLNFLKIPVEQLNPVPIDRLLFSTAAGRSLEAKLPQGGLGISRYALDDLFFRTAKKLGVEVIQEKIEKIEFQKDEFILTSAENEYRTRLVLGAYGKRSILDRQLQRSFFRKPAPWVAVKRHFKNDIFEEDLVALHNFKGGYCGLSRTETGAVNCCYLASYKSFKAEKDVEAYETNVLQKNPFLKDFFETSEALFDKPLTIAQISFSRKEPVQDHILMLGDAAGLIHPLCGNGMAMAIHSAKIASEAIIKNYTAGRIERAALEKTYQREWNKEFSRRLLAGKWLQKILLNESLAAISHKVVSKMPFLLPAIIEQTHGKPVI